jgi:hypothetical protein
MKSCIFFLLPLFFFNFFNFLKIAFPFNLKRLLHTIYSLLFNIIAHYFEECKKILEHNCLKRRITYILMQIHGFTRLFARSLNVLGL